MSIATYLTALDRDRDTLAANLTAKGVPASSSETFTTLVPKVLDIPSGGSGGGTEISSSVIPDSSARFQNFLTKISIDNPFTIQINGYISTTLASESCKELYIKSISPTSSSSYNFLNNNCFPLMEKLTVENLIFDSTTTAYMYNNGAFITGCTTLKELNLTIFNCTAKSCYRSFRGNKALTKVYIDLSDSSNTSTFLTNWFQNCTALKEATIKINPALTGVNLGQLFRTCSALEKIDLSEINFNNVSGHASIFSDVPTNCTIYVKDAATQALLTSWDSTHTYTIKT